MLNWVGPTSGLDGGVPGAQTGWGASCADTESLGKRLLKKSLVFLGSVNIYDVILWRHTSYLNCNTTFWYNMIFDYDNHQFVKLLQNRSPEALHLLFFENLILGDPTFSSSALNANPRSAIDFMTETKCCRSDFQYSSYWLTWQAISVSILPSDLHLRLNITMVSKCFIDFSCLLSRPIATGRIGVNSPL